MPSQFPVINDNLIEIYGEDTLIDKVTKSVKAMWDVAQPERVQMFLDDNDLRKPFFEVMLVTKVIGAPWNISVDSRLVKVNSGWNGTVRRLTAPGHMGDIQFVHAIVVLGT